MAYSYDRKWIDSRMHGAPALTPNLKGGHVAIWDALLINGWGSKVANGITVADGVGTIALDPGTTFLARSIVKIDGCSIAGVNGEARVLSSADGEITFETDASDGVDSGACTIRYAPQGNWEHAFAPDNDIRVYRQKTGAVRPFFRVDNGQTQFMRWNAFLSMSDINTGTNPIPDSGYLELGTYAYSSSTTRACEYTCVADSAFVGHTASLAIGAGVNSTARLASGFGRVAVIDGTPVFLLPSGDSDRAGTGWLQRQSGSTPSGILFTDDAQALCYVVNPPPANAVSGGDTSPGSWVYTGSEGDIVATQMVLWCRFGLFLVPAILHFRNSELRSYFAENDVISDGDERYMMYDMRISNIDQLPNGLGAIRIA